MFYKDKLIGCGNDKGTKTVGIMESKKFLKIYQEVGNSQQEKIF